MSAKIKHNKKRNTIFLYEALVRELTKATVEKDENKRETILDIVKENDLLFLDGTFYSSDELPHRDISKVPHPFVSESTKLFSSLDHIDKQKILFTHLNHSNPLLNQDSLEFKSLIDKGFKVLNEKQTFPI